MVKSVFGTLIILFFCRYASAQVSPDCTDAIPICNNTPINGGAFGYGMDDFYGIATSGCLERTTTGSIESNSGWYKFRTAASGQLGFNIGHDSAEDWDFALYKASDCNTLGDPIRCNFFDNTEEVSFIGVGEDPTGNQDSVHYEDWLEVNEGEDYYLFINNFSNVNSGFSIQFTGDIWVTHPYDALDCSIVNNLLGPPVAACENDPVLLDATTSGATSYKWFEDHGNGFQQIVGVSSATYQVLDSGNYRVVVTTATGDIISEVQVGFNTAPVTNEMADEAFCHTPDMIFDLSAKDQEALGSQDSHEFVVSYHLSKSDAILGVNALEKQHPKEAGQETIYVRTSSLANPNCFDASQSFVLDAVATPALDFDQEVVICEGVGSAEIGETFPDSNYSYSWSSGEQASSIVVDQAGEYTLTVTHSSNGVDCKATRTVTVSISNLPVIANVDVSDMSVNNTVTINTETYGDFEFRIDDGDYQSSSTFEGVAPGTHRVFMRDRYGCGEVSEEIVVVGFLTVFSPNGDVLNELWQVEGLSTLNSPIVTIYDRYGKLIKQMNEFDPGWDGSFNGKPLPSTDYWFKLSYLDNDGNRVLARYLQNHFSLRR